ncbi:hypothetical protein P3T27_008186, partial [Kitasatospora sp. MAA19]|uniref:hypothetical protein n=1 Tax=Kitasatospora sp. MAA19 TaxID=3035090 RepID=UPI002475CF84
LAWCWHCSWFSLRLDRNKPRHQGLQEGQSSSDSRYLLSLVDALRRKLTAFLEETENGDPVAAFRELPLRLPGYSSRVFATAQNIRDKTRWSDLTESERVRRRVLERIDVWGDGDDQEEASASRGETPDDHGDQEQPDPVPADVQPARATSPAVLPRQQDHDPLRPPPEPYLRNLGRFDLIRNISTLMGEPGWDLAGWTRVPGLFYIRKDGRALAWTEHGVNRLDDWGVVIEGSFLSYTADPRRPLAADTVEQAARLVRDAMAVGLVDADTAPRHR